MPGRNEPPGRTATADAIEVTVRARDVDLVSGLLWGTGISALAEHPTDDDLVVLRVDVPPGGADAVRRVVGHLDDALVVEVTVDDGFDHWRDHAAVTRAGERLVVWPPWLPRPETGPDDVVIELEPGHSWGHGAHPTTRLCLAEIERVLGERPGCGMIDLGCGSGALAIAAARLGAGWVEAHDVDPVACQATRENASRNDVADVVEVQLVPLERGTEPFDEAARAADLIVANIGAAALVELAPALTGRLADDGMLVLSGLLESAVGEVVAAYAPHRIIRTTTLDGWVSLVVS